MFPNEKNFSFPECSYLAEQKTRYQTNLNYKAQEIFFQILFYKHFNHLSFDNKLVLFCYYTSPKTVSIDTSNTKSFPKLLVTVYQSQSVSQFFLNPKNINILVKKHHEFFVRIFASLVSAKWISFSFFKGFLNCQTNNLFNCPNTTEFIQFCRPNHQLVYQRSKESKVLITPSIFRFFFPFFTT